MKFIVNIFAFILVFRAVYSMNIPHSNTILRPSESTFAHANSDRIVPRDEPGVCETNGCIKAADHILQSMDSSADPCEDFYQFACGGWLDKHSIREDRSSTSIFQDVTDELNLKVKELLERPLSGSEVRHVQLMKQFYDSCMDTSSIEAAGGEPLKNVLQKLGGWPVVMGDSWDESKFDWMDTLIAMRNLGFGHSMLLTLYVTADSKDNTINIIELDQTSLGMPSRDYLVSGLSDNATAAYFNFMVKSANKLGADESKSEKELMEALNFEITLANHSLPLEEQRNASQLYNKYTVAELKQLVPGIDWLKFLNGLLNDPITESESLNVRIPAFVKKFAEIIKNTDKRTIANYMIWRVVSDSLSHLSKDWRDLEMEYTSTISGQTKEEPRWEQCLTTVSYSLSFALGSHYVKNYFPAESKKNMMEMVKYLRAEFLKIIDNVSWMDDDTKSKAKDKANTMTHYIAYPDELLNDTLLEEFHENLTFTSGSYIENSLRINKWLTDYAFSELRKPNVKGDWKKHAAAAVVNAFYNPVENSIEFPAGILQNIFFNKDRPNYMNFGGIGYVIGHEITHGFDDEGRQYDKDGNNKDWWDATTSQKFTEKAQCIIDQYGNYTAENGMQINGIITQGENIADNGGILEAYLAYQSWVSEHTTEPKLAGLEYTPNQLFWISAANVWCGKYKPEILKQLILSDYHSPLKFRVNGPMSNIPEFSKDFQCQPGTAMNPSNKCKVW